ncbi:MAG: hypothetical protein H8E44_44875 [Planctomycetes bacterium]|nr:hypothetical protein [Planctomycetota bacterium]MBL7037226.1 hypothetical protein [Pirellulaceae bacterium]
MALEPAGYADKLGNRYEGRWAARQLLRVLNEDYVAVTVEAIGDDEKGVDLWIDRPDGCRQAQQCKVRNRSYDRWTPADLNHRDILSKMRMHLDRSPSNEFALVTAVPATLLHDLCESARKSTGDPEDFYRHQVQAIGEDRRKTFSQFCRYLGLDCGLDAERALAYGYLRRLFIELWPDTITSREELLGFSNVLVNGDPATVVAVLADFAQENLRTSLTGPAVWQHLVSRGFHPRQLTHDNRILPSVQELCQRFEESISRDLIAGEPISRKETQEVLSAMRDAAVVVLHGSPGQGKSGVLHELTRHLDNAWIHLPIRLDRQTPRNTPRQFGQDLGLPESPVKCLEVLATEQPAVLILDQLDAIRWTSRHSLDALDVCKRLVREVKSLRDLGKQIGVVLACRTYDLENDPEIKSWLNAENTEDHKLVRIKIGPLPEEAVVSVVQKLGREVSALSDGQKLILQSPQHLAMWVRLVQSGISVDFQNRVQLMRNYWNSRIRELAQLDVSVEDATTVLTTLVDYMERNGSISAPQGLTANVAVLDALCACGLVQIDGSQVTFSHQSYLDYVIASRVVRQIHAGGGTVGQWLGGRERQSLFRREQLRQALCLLYEESPQKFLDTVRALLGDSGIRFHLKHLVLEIIGQLDDPNVDVFAYMRELVENEAWKEHILGIVYCGHPSFIRSLINGGAIAQWLESNEWRDSALWMLRTVADATPDEVANSLAPFASLDDDEWRQRVLGCLCWNAEDDSDRMFELRLELARNGTFQGFVSWDKLTHSRALRLLEAVVSSWRSEDLPQDRFGRSGTRRSSFEHWTEDDAKLMEQAARELPEQTWELLVPNICRLAPGDAEHADAVELWLDGDRYGTGVRMECIPNGLVWLAIEAGRRLAIDDSARFWQRTADLRHHGSPVVQNLLIETYSSLSAECADLALQWLLQDSSRLNIGTGENEPEWMPATRLIEALSPYCSGMVFQQLEEALIHYHSPRERRDAEYLLPTWKNGYFGDYWGRAQHFLLPALWAKKRSSATVGLIGVLERKFEGYSEDRFARASRARSGFVGSTLLSESLERISDKAWLHIVGNREIPEDHGDRNRWVEGHWEESSVSQFSRNLESVAKRFPGRFARLALEFPEDVHPSYKAAILEGLQKIEATDVPEGERALWRPAAVELVEQVLQRFGEDDSRYYAARFCRLMNARASETWSDAAMGRLLDYACNHPDPEQGTLVIGNTGGDFDEAKASVDNLLQNSLNCVRGVAAHAIGAQLRNNSQLLERFKETIEQLVHDPHPVVRTAAVEACLPVLGIDKDLAIDWFCKASANDLRVAASRAGVYYFNCGMESHQKKLAPLVRQMLESERDDVAQEAAEEVAARWLFHDHFAGELQVCLQGTTSQRKGLAQVAAHFALEPELVDKCANLIDRLKDDPEPDVRSEIYAMVRNSNILRTPKGVDLVRKYVDSAAFRDGPTALIHGLKEYSGSLLPFAEVLFAMCDQFVGPLRDASRDSSGGIMWDVSRFLPMMIRLYEQAHEQEDVDTVNRCLDAWDAMFEQRVGVVRELAKAIDY